jgi:[ribosomal protein S18]-alanine N-acetyltransferase
MSGFSIVPLGLQHIDGVMQVDSLSFTTPWSRESFEKEAVQNDLARYVVAVARGKVIGYAGVWIIAGEGQITNIAVHPDFRGKGTACKMLEALIDICRSEGVSGMTLEVRKSNIAAINLYKKHGFVEEGIRKQFYADNKEDALIMWKHDIQPRT